MKKAIIIGMLCIGFNAFETIAQNQGTKDPKAQAILDALSKKTKSYTSIKADFSYTLENKSEGINETQKGSIILKGKKYKIKIAGQEIISNGKIVWTFIKDADEVQINDLPDPEENQGAIDPTNIFTMYETGFKYKFVKEENQGGKTVQIIDLYPEKANEKPYHTVRLTIDKMKKQMISIKIKSKDGNNYIYKLSKFITNAVVPDKEFIFDKSAHPGVEVIDLRD